MTSRGAAAGFLALIFCPAALARAEDGPEHAPAAEWPLVSNLSEASGLAAASPRSVFVHGDEYGIVFEVDVDSGSVQRAFALGDPTVRQDFEGVAARADRIYLVTSAGRLFEAPIGAHRTRVQYAAYETGAGRRCEVEGLAAVGADDFLLLCKTAYTKDDEGQLTILRWSRATPFEPPTVHLSVPFERLDLGRYQGEPLPSGLEALTPAGDRLAVLFSNPRRLVIVTSAGALVGSQALARRRHVQPEGITRLADGRFVIVDEARVSAAGVLRVYDSSEAKAVNGTSSGPRDRNASDRR